MLPGEVWQVSKRNSEYFRSYLRKTTGGPFGPPPSGARVISGRRKHDHISDVLQQLNWLNVPQLVAYFDLNLTHRILTTCLPLSLRNQLSYNRETVTRSTRQSSHLSLFRPKNNHGKRCFTYRASKLYNSVAERNELREVTRHAFKSRARMLVQQM